MKPSFALNITDSTIGLLHRTARGWLQVGETQFDTADLAEALGYLRGSALGLSPGGLTTKLVLPNSQIKYLELDAPGPNDADRRTQIRAALVGRTPYNVEDLVFDWSGTGAKVKVAVLARETLDEAEAFATEHRFNPVSFVGHPAPGDFGGEPWFGPTKLAATLLEKGEKVDRDAEPVQIAARDLPKSHPGASKAEAAVGTDVDAASPKPPADAEKPTRAQRRAAAAAAAAQHQPTDDAALQTAQDTDATPVEVPAQTAVLNADVFPENGDDIAQEPALWREVDPALPAAAPVAVPVAVIGDAAALTVPALAAVETVKNDPAFPEVALPDAASADGVLNVRLDVEDDLPPAPSAASMAAFASRRGPDLPNPKQVDGNVGSGFGAGARVMYGNTDLPDNIGAKSAPPPLSRPRVGGDVPANVAPLRSAMPGDSAALSAETEAAKASVQKPSTAFVTAPSIPGSRKRKSGSQAGVAAPGTADARKSLTKPGGTFASSKDRGKPRYLGLILTGLLLLFLALIAAWSSFFMASNTATQNGAVVVAAPQTDTSTDAATADIPAVDDEMLADSQDPADFAATGTDLAATDVNPAADLSADAAPASAAPVADIATAAPPVASPAVVSPPVVPVPVPVAPAPEPAPVIAAATDSPNSAPLSEAQDEIFLAAIDAPPLALDPLTLPVPVASTDALPLPQLEPPPFGTVYQFDADGRIRPTPEGIITPEGVRLVAGKPPVLPPVRPEALVAAAVPEAAVVAAPATAGAISSAAPDVAAAEVPFPSDPALADARPKARPAGLAPATAAQSGDGAALTGPSATRVSSLRPLARPKAILAAGEAARLSTASASLAAQADQAAAINAAVQVSFQPDPDASRLAVAVSRRPAARPKDMSRAVEAAVAAAVRAPEPQVDDVQPGADSEPETASAAPSIPTRASVARQATYVNAINLSKINLIGVYGSKSSPYALIRQANGRYKKVKVGDSIDGGKVAAIGTSEVRYQKSGRMISLKLPKT